MSVQTLRAYTPAIEAYQKYCRSRDWADGVESVTATSLAEFLAHLEKGSDLKASTIGTYRSAVSSWARRGTLSDEPSLGSSTVVTMAMQGITNLRQQVETEARRQQRKDNPSLTPPMLAEIVGVAGGSRPRDVMMLAAAHVAVYGLLRPSEMLGQPSMREVRALKVEMITFWLDEAGTRRAPLLKRDKSPAAARASAEPLPHHFLLQLGPSKADQAGSNPPIVVAAPPAVRMLWLWLHMRVDLLSPGQSNPFVFVHPHNRVFMTEAELCAQLTRWGHVAGVLDPSCSFKGRSFRRGGAAHLMEIGASVPDMQAAGRWRSGAMPALYAGADAAQRRRMLISKSMAPAPAALGGRR